MSELISIILRLFTTTGAKERVVKQTVRILDENLYISEEEKKQVALKELDKVEAPWWASKRARLVIVNAVIWFANDYFKMGLSVEALTALTTGIIGYIVAKSYEQSKK